MPSHDSQNKANCSLLVFDKENLIEFPLDLLHYIYNYYVAMLFISHGLYVTHQLTSLSYAVTPLWCDHFCDNSHTFFVTLWLSHNIFPPSVLVIKEKKRKRKEILNNDLAILPSHDIFVYSFTSDFSCSTSSSSSIISIVLFLLSLSPFYCFQFLSNICCYTSCLITWIISCHESFYHKWSLTICNGCFDTLKSSKMQS